MESDEIPQVKTKRDTFTPSGEPEIDDNDDEEVKPQAKLTQRRLEEASFLIELKCHFYNQKEEYIVYASQEKCEGTSFTVKYKEKYNKEFKFVKAEHLYLLENMRASDHNKVRLRPCEIVIQGAGRMLAALGMLFVFVL